MNLFREVKQQHNWILIEFEYGISYAKCIDCGANELAYLDNNKIVVMASDHEIHNLTCNEILMENVVK